MLENPTNMMEMDDTVGDINVIEWRIENFSHCTVDSGGKIECVDSIASNLFYSRWRMMIYPKGRADAPDYLGIYIRRESRSIGPETLFAEFKFSLVTFDGVQTFKKMARQQFKKGDVFGFAKFAKLEDIFGRKEFLLQYDALTVRCEMRRLNPRKEQTSHIFVTHIPIEKTSTSFCLKDFKSICKGDPEVVDLRGSKNLLSLRAIMNKEDTSENREGSEQPESSMGKYMDFVMVKEKSDNPVHVWCCFKLLNEKKEVALEKSFSHSFSKLEKDEWILQDILDTTKLEGCIEDGNRLNFEVDFIVSESREQCLQTADLTPLKFQPNPKETTLMKDLGNFLKNSEYHDIVLRIGDDTFPAHKSFLAARSPRFKEIFKDLKSNGTDNQNQIQEVLITDVDKKTMGPLLRFIYTDKLEDVDEARYVLLYHAAQKYKIGSLQLKCASFFRTNLSSKQIYRVFLVADLYSDSELKTIVLNYILEHYVYVFLTPEWDDFSEKYETYADEILTYIRKKKQEKSN